MPPVTFSFAASPESPWCSSRHAGLGQILSSLFPTQACFLSPSTLCLALVAKPRVSCTCVFSIQVLPVFQWPAQGSPLQWSIPQHQASHSLSLSLFFTTPVTQVTASSKLAVMLLLMASLGYHMSFYQLLKEGEHILFSSFLSSPDSRYPTIQFVQLNSNRG